MSWLPTDLADVASALRQLVIFLSGALVWEKLKRTGVSQRFALLLAICVALAVSSVVIAIGTWVESWIL